MTPRLLARLARLTAAREAQWLEALRRHQLARLQSEAQLSVLAAYRERLAAGWQDGAARPAGQAQCAAQFAAASQAAAAGLAEAASRELAEAEAALTALAQVQARRERLALARGRAVRAQADMAERRADASGTRRRALPPRTAMDGDPGD